jgi:methionyl aminopeptidase
MSYMERDPGERSLFEDIFRSIERPSGDRDALDLCAVDRAARMIRETLDFAVDGITAGMTTGSLALSAVSILEGMGADPGSVIVRISPENVVWHGLPGSRILTEGEIVTLDIACSVRGWWADSARTCGVGRIGAKRENLIRAALAGMKEAVNGMCAGSDGLSVSESISGICKEYGVSLIGEGAGHGLGRAVHEPPSITYDGSAHDRLRSDRVYTAEPIFTSGDGKIAISGDGSAATADGEPSAHFEATVLLTEHGPLVLGGSDWMDEEPC